MYSQDKLQKLIDICSYYLHCLVIDDNAGVSVPFGRSPAQFSQLNTFKYASADELLSQNAIHEMRGVLRRERTRMSMFLGYPVCIRQEIAQGKAEGRSLLEPVLLYSVDVPEDSRGEVSIDWAHPMVNPAVVRRYVTDADEDSLRYLSEIEIDLGINEAGHNRRLRDLARELQRVRPEWPWIDVVDPDNDELLSRPLSFGMKEGLYNRAVIAVAPKSPFTQGLEWELRQLIKAAQDGIKNGKDILKGTALDYFIDPRAAEEQKPGAVFDPLGLNEEQLKAVQSAQVKPITVVTGPPGTGKSFFATALAIDHAYRKQSVLFATKNNPAIDVVMEKLHRTVEQNIAVRTGSGVYQTALARYLYEMSSESAPPHQLEALDELGARYQQIEENLTDLDEQISEFLSSTCLLNESQKQVESCISAYGNDLFDLICEDLDEISRMCSSLKADCEAAQFKNQPIFKKLFWLLLKSGAKRKCIERLICAHKDYPALFHQEDNIEQVQAQIEPLDKTITTIQLWNQRKSAVKKAASLETLTKKRLELEDERTDIAAKIWRKYNKTRSARLSRADREKLSQSGVVLKMLSSHTGDGPMGSELFAKFSQMTRTMSHLVPLWATTSLSVRGRIPFHGSFFDLVVLDETGQADIASCLPLLYRARRAVVVGDPKQLSHISHISQAHDPVLLKRYGLLESNSQFSYSANSMYDLAASCVEPSDIIQFRDHHRSHKDIIGFSNQHFYGGNLHISTSENKLVSLPGQQQALNWIDVDGQAERPSSGSLVNPKEAKAVVNTLRQQVFNHGYAGSIGVVSPFRAQVNLIRRYVNKDHELTEALEQRNFLVDTVHKFQGDERDWILFSSVLSSSGVTSGAHRFLANNGNLFNVAITRARASLTIFGSKKGLEQFPVEYLQAFYDYVKGIKESGMSSHPTPNAMKTDKSSAWEEKFYCALKDAGIEVLPQWSEDKYELDFALFNGTNKLDIEVDGQAYHENAGGGLSIKDQERNHRLMRLGWDVMRFWVFELREDMQGCVGRVEEWLHINGSKTGKLKN